MDSEPNQPDTHMSLSWSWPRRHTAPPARSPWAPCWPLHEGHLATWEQSELQNCVILTHCDVQAVTLFDLYIFSVCARLGYVHPDLCICVALHAHVPVSMWWDAAVCSIHPIGGLIEFTMLVAPVNDNVLHNGLWPRSVLWLACHFALKTLWFNEWNAYYFEQTISNERKSAPFKREFIFFLWRYFNSYIID